MTPPFGSTSPASPAAGLQTDPGLRVEARAAPGSQRILVADDEPGIRELLQQELQRLGFQVLLACDGAQALETLKKEKVDLVITDIKMPRLDGMALLEKIREIDPDIEVILATGYGTIENAVEAMKKGAYDFIQKPFNLDEMLALVQKALEKARLRELAMLYEASRVMHSTLHLEELLPKLVGLAHQLLKADDVALMLLGTDHQLHVSASVGLNGGAVAARLSLGERVAGKIEDWKGPLLTGDLKGDPRFQDIPGNEEVLSSLLCPLLSKTKVLGVLCAARTHGMPFSASDQRYMNILADELSRTIENAQLYRELEHKIQALNQAYQALTLMQKKMIQSEKLAAIGELASGVAHELNNPLTTIIGLTDLVLEDLPGKGQSHQDLETIKEQSVRCSKIIQNLLQFAREHPAEKKPIQVNDIIRKACELVQYEYRSSGLEMDLQLAPHVPEVRADPYQIQQVFLNLITNARHALKDRPSPMLVIRSRVQGEKVLIQFQDNGKGIPDSIRGRIFDPFFTTKPVGEGTGLGLSISYGIIQSHGGEISFESREGEGTTFTVELPAAH